ncbi:MAG: hypothetical protein HY841_06190 [Bacteroidetes bacterium]|nr:hypothetical protein [Bacteroidota bacterium]
MNSSYKLSAILPANETVLLNDIYLVLLYATRIPPHLLVSINGKIFTLSVKGATVDGELSALLQFIRRKKVETVFIRLQMPPLFSSEQLRDEIRQCTLAYPRADIGIATCLTPIKDFCHSVYHTETKSVNLIFDLLPQLQHLSAVKDCYHLNLEKHLSDNSFLLNRYEVNDVYEAIRKSSLVMA